MSEAWPRRVEMASSLIRGKYVIVKVESRRDARIIADGAVFQRDGVVVDVGPYADLQARHRPDEELGSAEHVVVPGFINGHHHVGLTPVQLGSPDHPLELWFASRMTARDVDPYLDTLYSAFDMLESGITTVQHLHGVRIAPAARVLAAAERVLKAYDDIGMRVSYSYALRDQNRLAYEADEAFAARCPAPIADQLVAFQHLVDLGVAGPQLTLGHGVWLNEADIDLVAQTGTMICHNASSNLRLRSGVGPLNHWAARAVKVAVGLDEAGINDDRDMLQEMRLVLRLHRVPGMDDVAPTCPQVLKMATEDGAATTPYAGHIGTLEPGRAADLVLLSWRQIAHPYLDPQTAVDDAVVQRAKTAGVAMVMVAGEVVLRDGRFTRVDREAALEELAASLRVPLKPEEERRRRLSREVFPVVKRFYDGWLDENARQPFYRPSSRV